jgi:putative resolvase
VKNKRLLSPKEAAHELAVFTKTIHRWNQTGKFRAIWMVGNQRRIPIAEVHRLQGQARGTAERCVMYARVSSARQEQDGHLARQAERLKEAPASRGYEVIQIITEQASSNNDLSHGVKKMLTLVENEAVDVVLIEYPDRLVCFGFGYLVQAFGWKGVQL